MKKLFTIVVVLMLSVAGYAQDRDWALYRVFAEANANLKTPPTVVFMGNSITEAWLRMRPEFFKEHNFAGRGISGQTSQHMLCRFQQDVIKLKPKVVVINAGTNDIAKNNGKIALPNILENIVSMAQLAKANKIVPVLTSVLPANRFGWRPGVQPADDIIALNKMIKEYAQANKIMYVDYYPALVDDQKGLDKKYSNDGVHPEDPGYVIMEDIILKALKKYVK